MKRIMRTCLFLVCTIPAVTFAEWYPTSTENLADTVIAQTVDKNVDILLTNDTTSGVPLTISKVTVPDGFPAGSGDDCNTTLAAGQSCTLFDRSTYSPITSGTATWSFDVSDGIDQYTKTITKQLSASGIYTNLIKTLPANILAGVAVPVEYAYINNSAAAQNIQVTLPTIDGLVLTTTCGTSLAADASCTVSGTYTPPTTAQGQHISLNTNLAYNSPTINVPITDSTTVSSIAVKVAVQTALPANMATNVAAPFVFSISNPSADTATNVQITTPSISGLSIHNYCPLTLPADGVCTVSGTFTPPAGTENQTIALPISVTYDQGAKAQISTTTRIGSVVLSAAVTTPLPDNLAEGTSAPFTLTVSNDSATAATGIVITVPQIEGLQLVNGCGTSLVAHGVCTVSGDYTAPLLSKKSSFKASKDSVARSIAIPATIAYDQGAPIALASATTVDDIALSGEVTTALPANMAAGVEKPIVFTISNNEKGTATGLAVTLPTMSGLSLQNNCPASLAANATCTISGIYTAPSGSSGEDIAVPISVAYDQGSQVALATNTQLNDAVALTGEVTTALPSNLHEGVPASILYTIRNQASSQATGITVNLPSITGLDLTTNCGATLAANGVCTVSGTYIPPTNEAGNTIQVPVSVSYAQGSPISLSTQTQVADIALTGAVATALPTNLHESVAASFEFTVTNTTGATATGVAVSMPSLTGLTITNNCPTRLTAGQVCTISGSYTPPVGTEGNDVSLPITVDYDQGAQIALSTGTSVRDIVVNGSVTQALPANLTEGVKAPITFTLSNTSGADATGFTYDLPNIDGLLLTNNCGSTIAHDSTCTITGEYTPSETEVGSGVSVPITVSYSQGADVNLSTDTHVADLALSAAFGTSLPDGIVEGVAQPVVFTVSNDSQADATGFSVTLPSLPSSEFVVTSNGCSSSTTLAAGQSCDIEATYTPPVADVGSSQLIRFTTAYAQGADITTEHTFQIANVVLTGSFNKPLPANIAEGASTPVVYKLSNNGGGTASNIQYTLGLTDVDSITNNCGTSLAVNSSCTISGDYKAPSTIGEKTLSVGVSYDQGSSIQTTSQTNVTDVALAGSFSKALPANMHEGEKAPVIYTLTNNSGGEATNIQYTLDLTGVSDIANHCTSTLAAHSICTISGMYTAPSNIGVKSLSVDVSYDQGDAIQETTQTTVADIALTGGFDTALPANIHEGETADVVYTLRNNTGGTATNIQYTLGLTDVSEITNNCGPSLAAHSECSISGTYTAPSSAGAKSISVDVSYNQGDSIQASSHTTISEITLAGSFDAQMPSNMHEGEKTPVTYTLTNNSGGEATNIQYILDLTDVSDITNHCTNTLAANSVCTISGTYTAPSDVGVKSLSVHVSYDQGDSIQETKQITVADIALTGGFDAALPANMHEGETADVVYTLRNNTGGTATNIQYTLGLTGVSDIANDCGPSLAAHSTCSISGTYTAPSNVGVKSLSVGVSYDQGNALQDSTQTMVADIALTGSFSKALPSNIHEGKKASITYTLSNNTGGTATNIQYTLGLTDVSDITNNCGPSLAAHSTCSISGTYTAPSNAGVKSLSVGVSYDQGDDIQDTTQTTVADIALTGAFDRALPANLYEGETADVVYTLSNNTGGTATNIQYTLGLTDVSGITTNCGSSLSAHTSCSISGTYIAPSNVGVKSLSVGVSYDQGNALQNTTQTTVADIALTGSFSEALPANMHEGESAPVTFTLTNSTGGEATNIQYALGLTDMDITTNDCGSTLAANSMCTISGTYTAPNNLGVRSLSVDVSYDQGNAFQATSQTTIADVALTGSFSKALPAELAKGETASVEFTLTNSTGGEAKNIQYTFGFTDVSSVVNNCNGTLAANSLCKITGTYTAPDSLGVQSISVGVSYDQGNPISETSQTTVIANATTMSAPSGTVNFAPNETTDIVVTNDGASNASNVQITLPSEISDHLAGGSTTSCASVASGGGTCTFVLPMDGSFSAPGSLDDLTVAGSNTNTLTLSSQAQDTLVTAPGITLTQPSNNYVLTVTNAGNSALSGFSLNATLPSGVTQESTTCTSTLAADSDCTYTYSATNTTSSSDTTLTFTYTVGGVQKSLVSNLVVPQTTVAINPDGSDVGQDIDADLAGGHFTIKNTGNYVWHLKTPSADSVTRDGADSWLTLNTAGAQADPNCSDVSTVSPGNSCNVNYTIASPFDYSAVVTASGLNISNTSQNLEPNAHVSIGIEGDNVERHLKYRSVVVTNLASATVTLSNITDPSPNANIAVCDKTGTPSANCPTAYLSSCFNGATIASGGHCLLWFYAKDSDSLSANTMPQAANISVTATPDGGSAATVTRSVDFVYGNRLYIAGDYDTSAGGVANTKYLAYWDGANWNAINGSQGPNNNAIAVYAYQGDIYIGGTFTSVDNVSGSAGIAKWDGESWSSLGSGMTSPNVRAIQAYQSNLYIAGNFSQVGGVDNTEKIARWDGASWHSVGTNFGSGGAVRVMVVYDNKLVIAGALNNINGINHDKIATWDGSSWAPLDSNVRFSKRLQALYVDPDTNTLYIGGFFGSSNITGVSNASGLVSYNGSTWSNVGAAKPSGGGVQTTVNAITSFDSHINISGVFNSVGGNSINHVAQWDGTTWSSMGANGADSFAAVFRVLGNQLYAGGVFTQVGNLTNIFAIARWDGSAWHAVGGNIQSSAANTGIDSLQIMPYLDLQ